MAVLFVGMKRTRIWLVIAASGGVLSAFGIFAAFLSERQSGWTFLDAVYFPLVLAGCMVALIATVPLCTRLAARVCLGAGAGCVLISFGAPFVLLLLGIPPNVHSWTGTFFFPILTLLFAGVGLIVAAAIRFMLGREKEQARRAVIR